MAYFYVKIGGTAIGDAGRYETQQTGSFATLGAANYYNDVASAGAATTSPLISDFINVSDLHTSAALSTRTYSLITIVAVDDENIDAARTTGNFAQETGGNISMNAFASGFHFDINNDFNMSTSANTVLMDCILETDSSGDEIIDARGDGVNVTLTACELRINTTNSLLSLGGGSKVSFLNVNITTTTAGVANLAIGFDSGGGIFYAQGSDLSAIVGVLIANVGASVSHDGIDVRFDMCKIASGVAFTNQDFRSYNQRALFTRCSDSSVAAEYQYHLHAFGGDVDDDSAIFRNEDEAFTESNQKISYKAVTNSDASLSYPLWLDFPVLRYSELSVGATDTLSFYLTSDTALTDKDIYIEISYPDGTNKQTPNFLTSAPTTVGGTLDLMAAGTTLTTDSTSTWTGGLTNKYQIDLNTSVDVGADCLPIVKVYITKPSVTIQIASEFGLS